MSLGLLIVLLCFFSRNSLAALFNVTYTINGQSMQQGHSNVDSVFDGIKTANIQALFPGYADSDAISILLDFRGLPILLTSATSSSTLNLNIAAIGLTQNFEGATRDESMALLKSWLKKDGGSALNAILKKLAEVSPFDPLAGNPQSLMGKMVGYDYQLGTTVMPTNSLGIDMQFRQFDVNGEDSKSMTIPLNYSVGLEKWKFFLNLPLSLSDVAGSKTYDLGMIAGTQIQLFKQAWIITGTWGTGLTGSEDLGGGGRLNSTTLSSKLTFRFKKFKLGMGNMLGSYQSQKIEIQGIRSDPGIKNTVVRNGLFFSKPLKNFEWDVFVLDTRYSGSPLYMDQYNELGCSIGPAVKTKSKRNVFRAGVSYLTSNKIKGLSFNMGFGFQ